MTYKNYWTEDAQEFDKQNFQPLWRQHSDVINTDLISKWLPHKLNRILKTDMFDEQVCDGLYPCLKTKAKKIYGLDISTSTILDVRLKYPEIILHTADVLFMPYKNNVFDAIISNSTLDHFDSTDQIVKSLYEFHRILKKNGTMILTIDNLNNVIVALRNKISFNTLKHLGILPYYMGASYRFDPLIQVLKRIGFNIVDTRFVMHCPRVLCVAISHFMKDHASRKGQLRFLKVLKTFECLSGLKTSPLTGYFIAIKAIKV